eukprot:COSAG01_NODE_649_length_14487_cov_12.974624_2_plen_111_part_00
MKRTRAQAEVADLPELVREVRHLVRDGGDGWCVCGWLVSVRRWGSPCSLCRPVDGVVRDVVVGRREQYCELVAELEVMYYRSPWPRALEQLLRWEFGGPWKGLLKEHPWM